MGLMSATTHESGLRSEGGFHGSGQEVFTTLADPQFLSGPGELLSIVTTPVVTTCDQTLDQQSLILLGVLQHPLKVFLLPLDGDLSAQLRPGPGGRGRHLSS